MGFRYGSVIWGVHHNDYVIMMTNPVLSIGEFECKVQDMNGRILHYYGLTSLGKSILTAQVVLSAEMIKPI